MTIFSGNALFRILVTAVLAKSPVSNRALPLSESNFAERCNEKRQVIAYHEGNSKQVQQCGEFDKQQRQKCAQDLCPVERHQLSNETDTSPKANQLEIANVKVRLRILEQDQLNLIKKNLETYRQNVLDQIEMQGKGNSREEINSPESYFEANFSLAQTDCSRFDCNGAMMDLSSAYKHLETILEQDIAGIQRLSMFDKRTRITHKINEFKSKFPKNWALQKEWLETILQEVQSYSKSELDGNLIAIEKYMYALENPKQFEIFYQKPQALAAIWKTNLPKLQSQIKDLESGFRICQDRLYERLANLPTEAELANFKSKTLPSAHSKVLQIVELNFSKACTEVIKKDLSLTPTLSFESRERFADQISAWSPTESRPLPKLKNPISKRIFAYTIDTPLWLSHRCDKLPELGLEEPLTSSYFSPSKHGKEVLGFTTSRIRSHNEATVTHEMGHWLSAALEKHRSVCGSQTKKIISCLEKKFNGTLLGRVMIQIRNNDIPGKLYNEDFADLFSVHSKESICYLSDRNINLPLSLKWQDGHSVALFRELHHRTLAGREIPASCTNYLKMIGQPDLFVEKCIKTPEDPTGPRELSPVFTDQNPIPILDSMEGDR